VEAAPDNLLRRAQEQALLGLRTPAVEVEVVGPQAPATVHLVDQV
jgi:hypothetical protein